MNLVAITGRVASDIELSYTPSGIAFSKFRIAVRDPFRKNEEGKAAADFFDVVCWKNSAEFAAKYLEKGSPVAVKGRLRQEQWKTDEGAARQRIVINADDVEANGPPKASEPEPQPEKPAAKPASRPAEEPDYDPFADDV